MSSTLHSGQAHCTSSALADLPGLEDVIPRPGSALSLEVLCVLHLDGKGHCRADCTPPPPLTPSPPQKKKERTAKRKWSLASTCRELFLLIPKSSGLAATVVIEFCYSECFLLFLWLIFKSNIYRPPQKKKKGKKRKTSFQPSYLLLNVTGWNYLTPKATLGFFLLSLFSSLTLPSPFLLFSSFFLYFFLCTILICQFQFLGMVMHFKYKTRLLKNTIPLSFSENVQKSSSFEDSFSLTSKIIWKPPKVMFSLSDLCY